MFYRAIVTNSQDPEKMGRCMLKIIGLHGDSSSGNAWAERVGSTDFGLNNKVGVSSTLQVGTWVWCFLDHDNPNKPVIIGTIIDSGDFHDNAKSQYGKMQTIHTASGHLIELGDAGGDSRIQITHSAGTKVTIDNSGNISIECVGDVQHNITGKLDVTTGGAMTFNSGAAFTVSAPSINLN